MPRYKLVDRSPCLLPVVLSEQIQSGTFEFALDHLVDHELNLDALDARFNNDEVGASACDPRVMLKIVLLAYSRGLISSRRIEHACLHNIQFIALSGDSQPSYTHIAKFVRELGPQIQADPKTQTCANRYDTHFKRAASQTLPPYPCSSSTSPTRTIRPGRCARGS